MELLSLCLILMFLVTYLLFFPRVKPDGKARVILNFRELSANVDHIHFKMSTIKDALLLVYQNCFFSFSSVDFKHAYFSVPVQVSHRKLLPSSMAGLAFSVYMHATKLYSCFKNFYQIPEACACTFVDIGDNSDLLHL